MRNMDEPSGGAPLLGEPLPVELANTSYAVRGRPREGLQTPRQLGTWLREVGLAAGEVGPGDLAAALSLRDAIRTVAAATVRGDPLPAAAVATVNRFAASPARWRELRADPEPHVAARTSGTATAAALSSIAAQAVELFGGPRRHDLRACQGPGCVLFFVRDGRREWCSHGCGNRARAARHYARTRRA